ncbi:MAG: sulfatase-like hydrolase/transferase [Pseudomonadota bacterium]
MRFLLAILIGFFWVGAALATPNILLVIADDMGLDSSPCHGVSTAVPTMPTLQKLCANGMVFDNFWTPPSCSPTRATIMTGLYPSRTGIGSAITPQNPVALADTHTTIFDLLAPNYATALIGKWHLDAPRQVSDHPQRLGVGHYFGLYAGSTRDYFSWTAVENGNRVQIANYATTELTDRAIDWVGAQQRPWFLWLAYNAPHTPFHQPPPDLHSVAGLAGGEIARGPGARQYYEAALEALDTELGRLLDSLSPDSLSNTIILFIGDNGTPFAVAQDPYRHRSTKASLWQGGINTPLIVSGPTVPVGRSDALAQSTDLFATIAAFAGIRAPQNDARDLSIAIRGGQSSREFAYVEHFSQAEGRRRTQYGWAIRDDTWKLIQPEDGAPLLFNLRIDPFETINMLGTSPEADEALNVLTDARRDLLQ